MLEVIGFEVDGAHALVVLAAFSVTLCSKISAFGDCNELPNGKNGTLQRGCQRELRWARLAHVTSRHVFVGAIFQGGCGTPVVRLHPVPCNYVVPMR